MKWSEFFCTSEVVSSKHCSSSWGIGICTVWEFMRQFEVSHALLIQRIQSVYKIVTLFDVKFMNYIL